MELVLENPDLKMGADEPTPNLSDEQKERATAGSPSSSRGYGHMTRGVLLPLQNIQSLPVALRARLENR